MQRRTAWLVRNQTVDVTQLMGRGSLALSTGDFMVKTTDVYSAQDASVLATSAGPSEMLPPAPPPMVRPSPRSTRTSHRAGKFHRSMAYTKWLILEAPFGETLKCWSRKPFSFIP